jgi:hypothetical protein
MFKGPGYSPFRHSRDDGNLGFFTLLDPRFLGDDEK